MNKDAITSRPVNDLSRKRWSPRAFLEKAVEQEKLVSILEAARWSASGGNEQPWRFIIGLKPDETWEKLFSSLDDGNKVWCQTVPVLILAVANKISSWDGNVSGYYQYDTGQALAHLSLEAMQQGLFVHQMGGFSKEAVARLFDIPDDFSTLTVTAVGYIGDAGSLPENLKKRELQPRVRKELREIVFNGSFGKSAGWLDI
jgi:hypothetical protein